MPKFKDYNQNQSILLPPNIRDWIPSDHICFAINDIVDSLNISCIKSTYSENGCPAYDPRILTKIIFFSYVKGIRSSRRIEELAKENIAFRFLSANQCPDHGTISLFRKNHLTNLENLFAQIVIASSRLNMINPGDISIDGSVFRAAASKKKTYAKKDIDKIKKKIRKMLQEAEAIDKEEDRIYGDKGYSQMPQELVNPETRKKKIKELLDKMKKVETAEKAIEEKQKNAKTEKEKKRGRNTTYNTTDPEARLMKMKNSNSYNPAYNGQIAVSNHVITAYEITDDNVDTKLLIPMIEKTESNTGKKVEIVKADSIYFSKQNMDKVDEREIDAYIPDTRKSLEERQERDNEIPKYARRNFKYDESKDEYICPENKRLTLSYEEKSGAKRYVCGDCGSCSARNKCSKGKYRYLQVDYRFEKQKQTMRQKLNSREGKQKYLERMSEVEPVFGNIIYNQKAGNFLCRGKPMIKTEFGLSCIAHNLIKIANWIKKDNNKQQFDILMKLQTIN